MGNTMHRTFWLALLSLFVAAAVACFGGGDDDATDGDDGGGGAPAASQNGAGGDGDDGAARSIVLAALERAQTAEAYGYAMSFTLRGIPDLGGSDFTMELEGAIDPATESFSVRMNLGAIFDAIASAPDADPQTAGLLQLFGGTDDIEIIVAGENLYIRWGLFQTLFGVTTEWVSIPTETVGESAGDLTGSGLDTSALSSPSELLAVLEAFDSVEDVGSERVRGADTTHFRALFDFGKLAETLSGLGVAGSTEAAELSILPPLPFDVWVDGDGNIRRLVLDISDEGFAALGAASGGDSAEGSFAITVEFFDFGEVGGIEAPDDSDVTVLDEGLLGGLGGF